MRAMVTDQRHRDVRGAAPIEDGVGGVRSAFTSSWRGETRRASV
jgi:hypothetical protein